MNILTVYKKLFICDVTIYIFVYKVSRLGRINVPNFLNVLHVLKTFAKTAKPNLGARPAANLPVQTSGRNRIYGGEFLKPINVH